MNVSITKILKSDIKVKHDKVFKQKIKFPTYVNINLIFSVNVENRNQILLP